MILANGTCGSWYGPVGRPGALLPSGDGGQDLVVVLAKGCGAPSLRGPSGVRAQGAPWEGESTAGAASFSSVAAVVKHLKLTNSHAT
jgi:hypothetical protein